MCIFVLKTLDIFYTGYYFLKSVECPYSVLEIKHLNFKIAMSGVYTEALLSNKVQTLPLAEALTM